MKYLGKIQDPKDLVNKEWVENTIEAASQGSGFTYSFSTSSWSTSSGTSTISIPASTHGMGANFCLDVWKSSGSGYVKSSGYPDTGYSVYIDETGNVTLQTSSIFAGKVVIR